MLLETVGTKIKTKKVHQKYLLVHNTICQHENQGKPALVALPWKPALKLKLSTENRHMY